MVIFKAFCCDQMHCTLMTKSSTRRLKSHLKLPCQCADKETDLGAFADGEVKECGCYSYLCLAK